MQVTLIHNSEAGSGDTRPAELAATIRQSGHDVRMQSSKQPDWQALVDEPADLFAIAGGDGTVGRVARRLVGRGIPIAILATGTANNIATTLGIRDVPFREQIEAWERAERLAFDVLIARGPFGTEVLLEGLGCGLFVWAMKIAQTDDTLSDLPATERVPRALETLIERLGAHPTTGVEATLDDIDITGDYVLFEAMNTQFIGPNLFLSAQGHPGDGLLDVVTVSNAERGSFRDELAAWKRGALRGSALRTRQGKRLVLRWRGYPLHLDDHVWPEGDREKLDGELEVEVCVQAKGLEFLLHPYANPRGV